MHSYVPHGSKWNVVFIPNPGYNTTHVIRVYNTEAQAAAFASYLNGGSLPDNAAYGSPP